MREIEENRPRRVWGEVISPDPYARLPQGQRPWARLDEDAEPTHTAYPLTSRALPAPVGRGDPSGYQLESLPADFAEYLIRLDVLSPALSDRMLLSVLYSRWQKAVLAKVDRSEEAAQNLEYQADADHALKCALLHWTHGKTCRRR